MKLVRLTEAYTNRPVAINPANVAMLMPVASTDGPHKTTIYINNTTIVVLGQYDEVAHKIEAQL